MSTRVQSRRPSKRSAVRGTRRQGKMVLGVDLNAYPDEIPASSWVALETSDTAVYLPSQAVAPEEGAGQQSSAPIDVDAIDDEVVLLSSSRGCFPQASNRSRRATTAMVILDEDSDVHRDSAGDAIEDPVTVLTLDSYRRHERNVPRREVINCEAYEILESSSNAKRKEVVINPEPQKVIPKEPTFSCALCWGELVNETSTICGHIFCQDCIKAAIKAQKKCPTCRKSLTMRSIHRVYLPTAS